MGLAGDTCSGSGPARPGKEFSGNWAGDEGEAAKACGAGEVGREYQCEFGGEMTRIPTSREKTCLGTEQKKQERRDLRCQETPAELFLTSGLKFSSPKTGRIPHTFVVELGKPSVLPQ